MSEHTHEHTHADGTVHTHEHTHECGHEHEHTHECGHEHKHEVTPEALLAHMIEHNENHTQELEHLASHMQGVAADKVMEAVATFRTGNEQLHTALELLKK